MASATIGQVGVAALFPVAGARPLRDRNGLFSRAELSHRGGGSHPLVRRAASQLQARQDAELAAAISSSAMTRRWILLRDSLMALAEGGGQCGPACAARGRVPSREALDNLGSEDQAQRAGAIGPVDSSIEAGMLRPLIPVLEGKDVDLDQPPFAKPC